jgi:hypothetical protein
MSADARQGPIAIAWTGDGLIGRLTIGGELWAAVEWSKRYKRWCIEDAAGRCLAHIDHIHADAADSAAAIALAEGMIRDGSMPDPETAKQNWAESRASAWAMARKQQREKQKQRPAEIRKREEKLEQDRRWSDASQKAWQAKWEEEKAPPLYEALADAFDFADPELWKSNSFASLRPRLVRHVGCVIAELEADLAYQLRKSRSQPFCGLSATKEHRQAAAAHRKAATSLAIGAIETKLARAREILGRLDPDFGSERAP